MRHARSLDLLAAAAGHGAATAQGAGAMRGESKDAVPVVEIWTDGACKGNPGPGGWGVLLRSAGTEKEFFGGERRTTNNRMELTAVIEALRALKTRCHATVHTDSQYVKLGMTEWIGQWRGRGWKTADRKPVKNVDLWQELDAQVRRHETHWRWVRGHAGDAGNERADALANLGVQSVLKA